MRAFWQSDVGCLGAVFVDDGDDCSVSTGKADFNLPVEILMRFLFILTWNRIGSFTTFLRSCLLLVKRPSNRINSRRGQIWHLARSGSCCVKRLIVDAAAAEVDGWSSRTPRNSFTIHKTLSFLAAPSNCIVVPQVSCQVQSKLNVDESFFDNS